MVIRKTSIQNKQTKSYDVKKTLQSFLNQKSNSGEHRCNLEDLSESELLKWLRVYFTNEFVKKRRDIYQYSNYICILINEIQFLMMNEKVWIVGLGAMSSIGNNVAENFNALMNSKSQTLFRTYPHIQKERVREKIKTGKNSCWPVLICK